MEDDSVVTAASSVVSAGGIAFDDKSAVSADGASVVSETVPAPGEPATRERRVSDLTFDDGEAVNALRRRETRRRRARNSERASASTAAERKARRQAAMATRRVAVAAKYAEGEADDASLVPMAGERDDGANLDDDGSFVDDGSVQCGNEPPVV